MHAVREDLSRALQERSRLIKTSSESIIDQDQTDAQEAVDVATQVHVSNPREVASNSDNLGKLPHTKQQIGQMQKADQSLQGLCKLAKSPVDDPDAEIFWEDGVLFRRKQQKPGCERRQQIVLPAQCRAAVLEMLWLDTLAFEERKDVSSSTFTGQI